MSKTTIPAGGITDSAVTTAKINADAVDATKIADDAISEEHLDATAITGHTALTSAPAGTDEFLISDGGVLKRLDASLIGGAGLVHLNTTSNSSAHGSVEVDGLFSSGITLFKKIFNIPSLKLAASTTISSKVINPTPIKRLVFITISIISVIEISLSFINS